MKKMFLVILALAMCFVSLTNAQSELNPKKYRTPEDVLRQIVDDSTQAIRVEVVPSPDNRTLTPLKRKENNRGMTEILRKLVDPGSNRLKIEFTNFQLFPYDKLVAKWNSTEKVFRIFVDDSSGSDTNDGQTWAKALKTIDAIKNVVPLDLKGYSVFVLVKSGTYPAVNLMGFFNGAIEILWVGTFANSSSSAYSTWVRNGAVNPIDNDTPVNITCTSTDHAFLLRNNSNLTVTLNAVNWDYAYNQVGYGYWGRIIIKRTTGTTSLIYNNNSISSNTKFYSETGIVLDMENLARYAWAAAGTYALVQINECEVVGYANSAACTNDTHPADGAFFGSVLLKGTASIQYAAGFSRPVTGKPYYIKGVKSIYGDNNQVLMRETSLTLDLISYDPTHLTTYTPKIQLGTNFGGYLKYDNTISTLSDLSKVARVIVTMPANTTSFNSSQNTADNGTDFIMPSTILKEVTTEPTVTQDTQAGMYIKADKVIFKFNSGGTIKYRVMNLADTTATWTYTTIAP